MTTQTMDRDDQIKALLPDLINGKTHQQLMDEITAEDKKVGNHFVDGVKFPWTAPQSNLDALKTFEVRDDDVFVLTYPKSGSHWMVEIMNFILNDGKDDFDRTFMTTMLEITFVMDPSLVESTTPGYKIYETMKSPRCIWGHSPERFLPPQVFAKQAKVVYVARNPKDMFVSNFKMKQSNKSTLNIDELLWSFYCGQVPFGSWFDHVLTYWKHKDDANFLFLKYEDLQKDLRGAISKLAKHVGKHLSDEVIDSIAERVTFAGMQKTYQKVKDDRGEEGKLMTGYGISPVLRKGKVGGWKNTFTVAQNELFDKIYALKMQGTGLELDFEL